MNFRRYIPHKIIDIKPVFVGKIKGNMLSFVIQF